MACQQHLQRRRGVNATLLDGDYQTGSKISQAQMDSLNMRQHRVLPMWNYTLVPRTVENVI